MPFSTVSMHTRQSIIKTTQPNTAIKNSRRQDR